MSALDKAIKTIDMPFNNSNSYNHKEAMDKARSLKVNIKKNAGVISTYGAALDKLVENAKKYGTSQEIQEIDAFATNTKCEIMSIINRF